MRKAIAVIGEGITEKYYIESIRGLSPFNPEPRLLNKKASSTKFLEKTIIASISKGYDEIYCLIDMDGKQQGKPRQDYLALKSKYHNRLHGKKRVGIQRTVTFIETERCTELWFLFHFLSSATTREFRNYEELQSELRKFRPNYEKTDKYFRSVGNLHEEMTNKHNPNGSLCCAIKNAKCSLETKERENRHYTYSEMHLLLDALGIPTDAQP